MKQIKTSSPMIDIIIPVYRGLAETQACIESVLCAKQDTPYELVVLNDASPEPELTAWLDDNARAGRFTLICNAENLGFVGTVNKGMSLHPDRDVVILNSDTQVANDWLVRICQATAKNPRIGTLTPFSNNATICSYPRSCEDNEMPRGWDLPSLDKLFAEANKGITVDIPTGVGFCMYIRRACLTAFGLFDFETFGKGYGEENDFCRRIARHGWKNVLLCDTFVYHSGGVSFGLSSNPRIQNALQILAQRYPDYDALVQRHVQKDAARPMRLAVDMLRIVKSGKRVMLHISHNRNGGTEKHVLELAEFISDQAVCLLLQPTVEGQVAVKLVGNQEAFCLHFALPEGYSQLLDFLRAARVSRVHYHHTLELPKPIFNLAADLGLPHDFTVHDFYTVCPQISFTDKEGRYCGQPDEDSCNKCLLKSPAPGKVDIATWRHTHGMVINTASRVLAPSRDAAARLQRYFPKAALEVAYHPDFETNAHPPIRIRSLTESEPLRVLVLGALSQIKGADVLEATAAEAQKRGEAMEFMLLGFAYRQLDKAPGRSLQVFGGYDDATLLDRIREIDPHVVWFPAQWPETYSYTLSACLEAGVPVVVPDIGAFPERVAGRDWSWVTPWNKNAAEWVNFFSMLRTQHFESNLAPPTTGALAGNRFTYTADYLSGSIEDFSKIKETDLSLHAFMRAHGMKPRSMRVILRYKMVDALLWLRTTRLLAGVARHVPRSVQRRIKTALLGNK